MVAIRAMSFTNVHDRDWSSRYGIQRMRFDGFPFASRDTVTEKAYVSFFVQDFVVSVQGIAGSQ